MYGSNNRTATPNQPQTTPTHSLEMSPWSNLYLYNLKYTLAATIFIITLTRTCSLMTCVKVAIAQQKPTLDTLGGFLLYLELD